MEGLVKVICTLTILGVEFTNQGDAYIAKHLRMDGWKTTLPLAWLPPRCYDSFRWRVFYIYKYTIKYDSRLTEVEMIQSEDLSMQFLLVGHSQSWPLLYKYIYCSYLLGVEAARCNKDQPRNAP